jgi:hypothetical protein
MLVDESSSQYQFLICNSWHHITEADQFFNVDMTYINVEHGLTSLSVLLIRYPSLLIFCCITNPEKLNKNFYKRARHFNVIDFYTSLRLIFHIFSLTSVIFHVPACD